MEMDDLGIEGQSKEAQQAVSTPFLRNVKRISQVGVAISAVSLGSVMLLSITDILARNLPFIKHPIQGSSEIVGALLVVTASLGLGWCQLLKGNVRIDILYNRFKARGRALLDLLSNLMSIAITFIISWQAGMMMLDYMSRRFGGTTADLNIKIWPFWLIMAVGFAWVTFIFLIDLYDSIKKVMNKWTRL
jgi:TRAP-type C4-dicarboxylate transport system permease small subunit